MPRTKNPNPFHERPELAPVFQSAAGPGGIARFLSLGFLEGEIRRGPRAGRMSERRLRVLARYAFDQPIPIIAKRLKITPSDAADDANQLLNGDFGVQLPQQLLAAAVGQEVLTVAKPGLALLFPTNENLRSAIHQFALGKTQSEASTQLSVDPGTLNGWLRKAGDTIGFNDEAALVAGAVITKLYNPSTQMWAQLAA